MLRRLCALIAVALFFSGAGVGSAGAITPRTSPDVVARTALPFEGHYLGHDSHGRQVRFSFFGTQMQHFHVNHTAFGHARVSGARWHHTCNQNKCTQGLWVTDTQVEGTWNDPNSGHTAHWVAVLYAH